jgi:hypothetical protein
LTTVPHSFVALWGRFAVRDHGQTHIPKVAQFYSGQIRQNGALLLRRLAQFCSGVDSSFRIPAVRALRSIFEVTILVAQGCRLLLKVGYQDLKLECSLRKQ